MPVSLMWVTDSRSYYSWRVPNNFLSSLCNNFRRDTTEKMPTLQHRVHRNKKCSLMHHNSLKSLRSSEEYDSWLLENDLGIQAQCHHNVDRNYWSWKGTQSKHVSIRVHLYCSVIWFFLPVIVIIIVSWYRRSAFSIGLHWWTHPGMLQTTFPSLFKCKHSTLPTEWRKSSWKMLVPDHGSSSLQKLKLPTLKKKKNFKPFTTFGETLLLGNMVH